jgi:hypothetical protein
MPFISAANLIELVDYGRENKEVDYAQKIQTFHRFLLDHLIAEGITQPQNPIIVQRWATDTQHAPSPITQLIGVDAKNVIVCQHCKAVREKDNLTHVLDLSYPRKVCYTPITLEALKFLPDRIVPGRLRFRLFQEFRVYFAASASAKVNPQGNLPEVQASLHLLIAAVNIVERPASIISY